MVQATALAKLIDQTGQALGEAVAVQPAYVWMLAIGKHVKLLLKLLCVMWKKSSAFIIGNHLGYFDSKVVRYLRRSKIVNDLR